MSDGDLIPLNVKTREEAAYSAYQLRLSGEDWKTISAKLGFKSPSAAQREVELLITKAHAAVGEELKREVVDLELARLDALQNAVWGMALAGDLKAVDSALKIMSHRARILNLGDDSNTSTVNTIVVTGDDYAATLRGLAK